ncbi:hypothetical protein SAMN05421848_2394 [Kushneria avicenniae]|uniref:Uncharacterized protein n=1 Tax=Kushneria avicenniae TaxID=402385 RepID=A0A1I1LJT5_9GAMM|nr:hypothetical protein [Kushneria avicenniae]SFC71238.1 hypothetical protein SAMN05421848_2394 [Kushneria avicenniae]
MTLLTRSCALGALMLLAGYLSGAVLQNDPAFMHWPLPVRLTVIVFALAVAVVWLLVHLFVRDQD